MHRSHQSSLIFKSFGNEQTHGLMEESMVMHPASPWQTVISLSFGFKSVLPGLQFLLLTVGLFLAVCVLRIE